MTAFVLINGYYDDADVYAVFSTLEKAQAAVDSPGEWTEHLDRWTLGPWHIERLPLNPGKIEDNPRAVLSDSREHA